jgi:hypothetical protein
MPDEDAPYITYFSAASDERLIFLLYPAIMYEVKLASSRDRYIISIFIDDAIKNPPSASESTKIVYSLWCDELFISDEISKKTIINADDTMNIYLKNSAYGSIAIIFENIVLFKPVSKYVKYSVIASPMIPVTDTINDFFLSITSKMRHTSSVAMSATSGKN